MSVIGFRDQEHWGTVYEVMSLTRSDLKHEGLSVAQVDALTDAEMAEIASRLGQAIIDAGIWGDVPFIARLVLAEKDTDIQTSGENVIVYSRMEESMSFVIYVSASPDEPEPIVPLIDRIEIAIQHDEEDVFEQSERLIELYTNATPDEKSLLDACLICICGYSFTSLMDMKITDNRTGGQDV